MVGSSVTEMCLPVPEELNDGCIIVTTKLHVCVRGLVNRLGGGRGEGGGRRYRPLRLSMRGSTFARGSSVDMSYFSRTQLQLSMQEVKLYHQGHIT